MSHHVLTRSPSGLSERRTGFSPPELGSPTAPVVPPTGAVPRPDSVRPGSAPAHRVPAPDRGRPTSGLRPAASAAAHRVPGPQAPGSRLLVHSTRRPAPSALCGGQGCGMVETHPVLVVGCSGGLGASTLSLAVGRRLAATGPGAVVVDLDLDRGGLEVTAGVEHVPGRRWDELRDVRGRIPPDLLLASLPVDDGCHVLSARGGASTRPPERAVLDVLDTLRASRARVVVDVPASSPSMPALLGAGGLVVLLVSLSTRGLADADAAVSRLTAAADPLGAPHPAMVADRAGLRPSSTVRPELDLRLVTRGPHPGARVRDDVVAHLGVPHLHHLPDDRAAPREAEKGMFPGTHRDMVRRCAEAVVAVVDGRAVAS